MLKTYECIKRNITTENEFKIQHIKNHDLLLKFHRMLQNFIYACRYISKYKKKTITHFLK